MVRCTYYGTLFEEGGRGRIEHHSKITIIKKRKENPSFFLKIGELTPNDTENVVSIVLYVPGGPLPPLQASSFQDLFFLSLSSRNASTSGSITATAQLSLTGIWQISKPLEYLRPWCFVPDESREIDETPGFEAGNMYHVSVP